MAIQADVKNRDQVNAMFEQAAKALGDVDVLVNNAGVVARGDLEAGRRVLAQISFEFGELGRIPAEQVELVGGGADRALDPPEGVPVEQVVQPVVRQEEFLCRPREALAKRGGLRRDVV